MDGEVARDRKNDDAFGAALLAHAAGQRSWHVIERDDGYFDAFSADVFFAEPDEWPEGEAVGLDHIRGRVLDVGVGAGRYALPLQDAGCEVVGLDTSAGAVEVAIHRGVRETFVGTIFDYEGNGFDTFLLSGHNLGLLESPTKTPAFLGQLEKLARPGARIVGTGRDPLVTDDADHLAYQNLNVSRNREPGQLRLRIRYRKAVSAWFGYWMQPLPALTELLRSHGWEVTESWPIANGSYGIVAQASPSKGSV